MKVLIVLLMLLFLIPVVSADVAIITQTNMPADINMTLSFNSINDQLVINIPYQAFQNVSTASGFKFMCGKSDDANGAWAIRVYSYETIGTYLLEDAYSVSPSACLDFGYPLTTLFSGDINVTDYYSLNKSLAIGIYVTNTVGNLYLFGSNSTLSYNSPSIVQKNNITDADGNVITFPDGTYSGLPINTSYHVIYGTFVVPPTATPTPTSTVTVTATPIQGDGNNTNISQYVPYNSTGSGVYSSIPNGTGFDEILKSDGLCTTGDCKSEDAVEWLNRYIVIFWWFGFGSVLFRFYSMGKK